MKTVGQGKQRDGKSKGKNKEMLDNEKDFKLMIICYAEEAHNINM